MVWSTARVAKGGVETFSMVQEAKQPPNPNVSGAWHQPSQPLPSQFTQTPRITRGISVWISRPSAGLNTGEDEVRP